MCKRGNYFIAVYDREDNYICDFESIEDCAIHFQTSCRNISDYIFKKMFLKNEYRLFKIVDSHPTLNKSQRKGR